VGDSADAAFGDAAISLPMGWISSGKRRRCNGAAETSTTGKKEPDSLVGLHPTLSGFFLAQ